MSSVSAAVSMKMQTVRPTKTQQELAGNFELRGKKEMKIFSTNSLKIHILSVPRPVQKEPLPLRWSRKECH